MPSFDPARLDIANYAHQLSIETRFQDLDQLGHVNNVAMAGIFENGRVRFNHGLIGDDNRRNKGDRWLIARIEINYLAEAYFPDPIVIANAIGNIGNRSWQILAAASQNGQIVALCDATLVFQSAEGKAGISDALRADLTRLKLKS